MTTNPTYHSWFDLGVQKYRGWAEGRGVEVPDDPTYPCPLCANPFTREDLVEGRLTAEDVPPLSVGGRKILLTCKSCNNNQGSAIDSHAGIRERWIDAMTGVRITPFGGEHTVGGVTARVETWSGPGQIGIAYVPKQNNPNEHEVYKQAVSDPENTANHLNINPGFTWDLADLSFVRAAYLASFAAFGWSQIFRPAFLPLVRRLAGSDDELPQGILRYDPNETATVNKMLVVTEPGPQKGILLVQMGRSTVVLPGPYDNRTLHAVAEAINELVPNGEGCSFDGQSPDPVWPTGPDHRCDPDADAGQLVADGAGTEEG